MRSRHHPARAAAGAARVVDDLAAPLTCGTRALDGEEALARPHLAVSGAGGTGARPRSRVCPRAAARRAGDAGRDDDLRRLAGEGLGQRDVHVVAQVGAALAARALASAAAAHELAEQIVEDVGHRRGEVGPEAVAAPGPVERRVAHVIVGRALLRVLEDVVGLAQLLELLLGVLVAAVGVGVAVLGKPAIRRLQVLLACPPGNPQNFVVAALGGHEPCVPVSCSLAAEWPRSSADVEGPSLTGSAELPTSCAG